MSSTRIEIMILGKPCSKARPKFFRRGKFVGTYDPKANEKNDVALVVRQQAPDKPLEGPLSMTLVAYMPIPKSVSHIRRVKMERGFLRPAVRPDANNINRFYTDAAEGILYLDDSQIVALSTLKYYSDRPRVEITIEPVEGEE